MKSDIKRLVKRSTAGFLAVWMVFGNSISAFSNVKPVLEEQDRRRKKPCPQLWKWKKRKRQK